MAHRLILRLDGGELEAGEFRESGGVYTVACPACGTQQRLEAPHVVDGGGRVAQRWVCPSESCSFAEFLQLEVLC